MPDVDQWGTPHNVDVFSQMRQFIDAIGIPHHEVGHQAL